MSVKLIAMGNVLMKDDAIGIEVAKELEEKLIKRDVEVIYGETDFEYCFSKVQEKDFIFVLDAACFGKKIGEVTVIPLDSFVPNKNKHTQHNDSFLDLLKLCYKNIEGVIITIEIKEVEFNFGLSTVLQERLKDISEEVLTKIEEILVDT